MRLCHGRDRSNGIVCKFSFTAAARAAAPVCTPIYVKEKAQRRCGHPGGWRFESGYLRSSQLPTAGSGMNSRTS